MFDSLRDHIFKFLFVHKFPKSTLIKANIGIRLVPFVVSAFAFFYFSQSLSAVSPDKIISNNDHTRLTTNPASLAGLRQGIIQATPSLCRPFISSQNFLTDGYSQEEKDIKLFSDKAVLEGGSCFPSKGQFSSNKGRVSFDYEPSSNLDGPEYAAWTSADASPSSVNSFEFNSNTANKAEQIIYDEQDSINDSLQLGYGWKYLSFGIQVSSQSEWNKGGTFFENICSEGGGICGTSADGSALLTSYPLVLGETAHSLGDSPYGADYGFLGTSDNSSVTGSGIGGFEYLSLGSISIPFYNLNGNFYEVQSVAEGSPYKDEILEWREESVVGLGLGFYFRRTPLGPIQLGYRVNEHKYKHEYYFKNYSNYGIKGEAHAESTDIGVLLPEFFDIFSLAYSSRSFAKKSVMQFDGGILSKLMFQPKGYTDFGFGVNSDLGDLGLSLNFERGLSADDKDYGSLLYALRLSLSSYDLHYGEKTTSYSLFQTKESTIEILIPYVRFGYVQYELLTRKNLGGTLTSSGTIGYPTISLTVYFGSKGMFQSPPANKKPKSVAFFVDSEE